MAEPIARSPIRPAQPVKIMHGWEVSAHTSDVPLTITDCTSLSKVLVHAPWDGAVARSLGVGFGQAIRDEHATLVAGPVPASGP